MNQTEIRKKQLMQIIKIFGIITMILLTNLIGNLGMVYFAIAVELYFLVHTLLIDHIPEYMEKMVRNRLGKEQFKNAIKVYKSVMLYCVVLGLVISMLLFVLSDIFASKVFLVKELAIVLKLLAPTFFFSAVGAALQGYFQGIGTAMPTIIYHVIRQLLNITFTFLFGYILLQYGKNVSALLHNDNFSMMYGATGVALGVTASAILSVIFLFIVYIGAGRRISNKKQDGMRLTEDTVEIYKQLMKAMLPASGLEFILRLPVFLGILYYVRKAGNDIGLLGAFYVQYLLICGVLIYGALLLITNKKSILIHLVKKEELKNAKNYLSCGIQSLLIFTCFFTILVSVLASSILRIFFVGEIDPYQITECLQRGSLIIVFFSLGIYFADILIGIGKRRTVIMNGLASLVCSGVVMFVCAKIINKDLFMMVMGLLMFTLLYCLLNGFFLFRILHYKPDWLRSIIFPIIAALITGFCLFLLRKGLMALAEDFVIVIICSIVGIFCNITLLFVSKCIRERDFELIPGGKIVRKIGLLLHLI